MKPWSAHVVCDFHCDKYAGLIEGFWKGEVRPESNAMLLADLVGKYECF